MKTILLWLFMLQVAGSVTANAVATGSTTVAGVTPGSRTNQVAVSATVSATFTSAMDPATLNRDTFQVSGPNGRVSGSVTYDPSKKTATFTPFAPLMPQNSYCASLSTGVKDKNGQALSDNFAWNFKTDKDMLARSPSDVIPPTLFGQHMHYADTTTAWPTAPFGSWRLWDAYVVWPWLEPNKGEWHFEKLDNYLDLAEAHNVEVLLPLAFSPTWASARPAEKIPYGIAGSPAEPANFEDWKNYVRTVATRYKGRIHYYELWNEVNSKAFYSGSVDKMIDMAKETYRLIKTIDPSAKVISPSCTGHNVAWFKEYLQKGGGQYADMIGYHFYVTPQEPEQMLQLINTVKHAIADVNLSKKPLWNTESGWYIENHKSLVKAAGGFNVLSDSGASAYVTRAYLVNWASGIDRFYWYAWDNRNMGFVERDGKTVKKPAIAYAQTFNWLNGARIISCGKNNQGTWVAKLVKADAHVAWIVWNADKTVTMELPKEWNAKSKKDLAGNDSKISPTIQLKIGPSPILIEN